MIEDNCVCGWSKYETRAGKLQRRDVCPNCHRRHASNDPLRELTPGDQTETELDPEEVKAARARLAALTDDDAVTLCRRLVCWKLRSKVRP